MRNETTAGDQRGTADRLKEKVGDATGQVQEKASHIAAEARDKGEELIDEGREKVHELSERAGEIARSRADQERERVVTGIRVVADALRRGSDNLTGEREQFRPLLSSAADRVEGLTGYLESHNIDALSNDVRRFAREHTPAFLAGAFALGFAGARFLKSSGEQASRLPVGEYGAEYGYAREDRFDRMLPDTDVLESRTRATGYGTTDTLGTRTGATGFDAGLGTRDIGRTGTTGYQAGADTTRAGSTGFQAGADTTRTGSTGFEDGVDAREDRAGSSSFDEDVSRRGGSYE